MTTFCEGARGRDERCDASLVDAVDVQHVSSRARDDGQDVEAQELGEDEVSPAGPANVARVVSLAGGDGNAHPASSVPTQDSAPRGALRTERGTGGAW